ncbi:MAG: DUF2189 domain-containing protein [Bauldia sp.]
MVAQTDVAQIDRLHGGTLGAGPIAAGEQPGGARAFDPVQLGARLGLAGKLGARPGLRYALGGRSRPGIWSERTHAAAAPQVNTIALADLETALRKGLADFKAMPSHVIFLTALYPIAGLLLARLIGGYHIWSLLFPLLAGFALVGHFAVLALYEVSRRRERGMAVSWRRALSVFRSPAIRPILALGLELILIFLLWLATAQTMSWLVLGDSEPQRLGEFLSGLLATPAGWALLIVGSLVGLAFAAVVLTVSVIAFPLLIDRHVDLDTAVQTSVQVVRTNPVVMASWGLIVATLLVAGSLPFFLGLALTLPLLGHATWHLYRLVVAPPPPAAPPAPLSPEMVEDWPG